MQDLQPTVIAILRKFMRDPSAHVERHTDLSEIEIDALDLPMIFLDLEDALNVHMTYDDEADGFAKVGDLVARVATRLEEKRIKAQTPKIVTRPKRGWMSGASERRR